MDLLPKLKNFVNMKEKPAAQTALRLCRNVYHLNTELQKEFIKLGLCNRLVQGLKESDPISVIECFENIFSLILVKTI